MFKSTTMSKNFYATLILVFILIMFSGCATAPRYSSSGSGSSSGGSLDSRVSQLEQRLNNIDTSGSASAWSDQESIRSDMNILRNQMADLNNRLDGGGRGGDLSAEVAVLKQRVDRMEAAMIQLQAQLGLNLEAMKTPIAPPTSLNTGNTGSGGADFNNPPPPMPPQPQVATPLPPLSGTAPPHQTAAYGTVPPPPPGNTSGVETVILNGVPQQLAINPNAANTPHLDSASAAIAANDAPVQHGLAEGTSSDPATALYNSGIAAFNASRYGDALKIFSDFTSNFSKHELTSNAWFWQGESNYQMQNFGNAALSYQEVITKFPTSNKMPAAMLKQGMSFDKLGNRDAANARFKELISKYPNSPEATRAKALVR
jgi:tol-pal system protein YbgF